VHLLVFVLEEIALISVLCSRHLNAASHVRLVCLFFCSVFVKGEDGNMQLKGCFNTEMLLGLIPVLSSANDCNFCT